MRTSIVLGCALAACCAMAPIEAAASDPYLCAQLDRIRSEENMPAIGAGVVVPDPEYPEHAPLPWRFITCANGVTQWGGTTKVTDQSRFEVGSISKAISGLMVSRVIAAERLKANPGLSWTTTLAQFFPEMSTTAGVNHCYDIRTVADLMAHTAGLPGKTPTNEPNDEWTSVEPDPVKRRQRYAEAAVLDPSAVPCFNPDGTPIAQLPNSYSGGVIIASHMAEVATGRSWEDLMRHYGSTTAGPGVPLHDYSVPPQPYAGGHQYGMNGIPVPQSPYDPNRANAPAGNVHLTVPEMAKLLTEFLDGSRTAANRLLPDDERSGLMTRHGLSTFNRLGWNILPLDTANFGPVARWTATALWHNGSNGTQYAEVYIVPGEDSALFAMLTADGPSNPDGSLALPNRLNSLNKTFAELAALRLHHGDAAAIVLAQASDPDAKPVVESLGRGRAPGALVDGRLSTRWSAPSSLSTPIVTIRYAAPRAIDRIVVVEDEGARIRRYRLEYQDAAGVWHLVAKNESGKDLIYPHRIFTVSGPTPDPPRVFTPTLASVRRVRLRVLESTGPPHIVEIAASAIGGSRSDLPFWYRHGFEKVLSPPQGARIDRPAELAPERH